MQQALDKVYLMLLKQYKNQKALWDLQSVNQWGKAPATEKQLSIIKRNFKDANTDGLTKGQASQILNRLFGGKKK